MAMKMVTAVLRHTALNGVRKALTDLGVHGMTVVDVKGFGRQRGHTEIYRGQKMEVNFLPKIKLDIAVEEPMVDSVIKAIIAEARTGEEGAIGDGKIFVTTIESVVRIRTGQTGTEAL